MVDISIICQIIPALHHPRQCLVRLWIVLWEGEAPVRSSGQ